MQRISTPFTPAEFLERNLPTDLPDATTWPYALPLDAAFRCHNDLVLTRDHVRVYCAKRTPTEGCTCLTLNLRTLPASGARPAAQSTITFVSPSTTALPTQESYTTR